MLFSEPFLTNYAPENDEDQTDYFRKLFGHVPASKKSTNFTILYYQEII